MRALIDQYILDLFQGLFLAITDHLSVFINDAQALMAIFMLLYFGVKAYGMMVGDEPLQVMPLLRPFALALVVIFWVQFVDILNHTTVYISDKSKGIFENRIEKVDAVMMERMVLIDSVGRRLIETTAEVEHIQQNTDEQSWYEVLGISFEAIFDQMKGYFILITAKMRFFFLQAVEYLVITIFQVLTYLVFFLQITFAAILIILGPFSFAFSVLPGFKDAYVQWVARYLSVSLYSAIAYIIMSMSMVVVQYGMEREIEFLRFVLKNEAAFMLYISQNDGGSYFFIVTLLIGGLVMLTIPVISTWIISTSGVNQAVSQMTMGLRKAIMLSK